MIVDYVLIGLLIVLAPLVFICVRKARREKVAADLEAIPGYLDALNEMKEEARE